MMKANTSANEMKIKIKDDNTIESQGWGAGGAHDSSFVFTANTFSCSK